MTPLPYDPQRKSLYTTAELMAEYDGAHPETALDAIIAQHYKDYGGISPDMRNTHLLARHVCRIVAHSLRMCFPRFTVAQST